METFDLNVYLYQQPRVVFDNVAFNKILSDNNVFVVDCNEESRDEILCELNGHNFFLVLSNGDHKPIGFSCSKDRYVVEDMVKTILKNLYSSDI